MIIDGHYPRATLAALSSQTASRTGGPPRRLTLQHEARRLVDDPERHGLSKPNARPAARYAPLTAQIDAPGRLGPPTSPPHHLQPPRSPEGNTVFGGVQSINTRAQARSPGVQNFSQASCEPNSTLTDDMAAFQKQAPLRRAGWDSSFPRSRRRSGDAGGRRRRSSSSTRRPRCDTPSKWSRPSSSLSCWCAGAPARRSSALIVAANVLSRASAGRFEIVFLIAESAPLPDEPDLFARHMLHALIADPLRRSIGDAHANRDEPRSQGTPTSFAATERAPLCFGEHVFGGDGPNIGHMPGPMASPAPHASAR